MRKFIVIVLFIIFGLLSLSLKGQDLGYDSLRWQDELIKSLEQNLKNGGALEICLNPLGDYLIKDGEVFAYFESWDFPNNDSVFLSSELDESLSSENDGNNNSLPSVFLVQDLRSELRLLPNQNESARGWVIRKGCILGYYWLK